MAEIRYAVTHEGALHLEDVLTRRTRISIEYPHRGVDCAEVVADLIGAILGWDARPEPPRCTSTSPASSAERASQARFDDEAADAVRVRAPEVREHLALGADSAPGQSWGCRQLADLADEFAPVVRVHRCAVEDGEVDVEVAERDQFAGPARRRAVDGLRRS